MLSSEELAGKVYLNLVHYNLWCGVSVVRCGDEYIVKGCPPPATDSNNNTNSTSDDVEYIVPVLKTTKVSMKVLDSVFEAIEATEGLKPKKIILGIVDVDGTVVYYNVHDGIQKPRQS
ncbi:hypothetical protein CANARDRAFT_176075 [[Candida] arabinofermentans NRRL YB-2248]|uniref:tRNA-splicing endonuclease subunit Sen15 domain-containing protein n=1 Tax=[Candida] arabinofermentans NRRL YB-2248 TaxID=983967 RepID=A0A1E4T1L2_9ASCO|nr:hypothetical protein CANARDRAFT_176075 [[Candida] arabinofermentans NRRL YB-2248]